MPQALVLPLHCAKAEGGYTAAVELSTLTGGCTASRASLAGACAGAAGTDAVVPKDWLGEMQHSGLESLAAQLMELRPRL